jgi:hypothetical protein
MQQLAQRAGPAPPTHPGPVRRGIAVVLGLMSGLVVAWVVVGLLDVADTYGNIGHGWEVVAAVFGLIAWALAVGAVTLWSRPVSVRLLVVATVLSLGGVIVAYLGIALATGTFGAA